MLLALIHTAFINAFNTLQFVALFISTTICIIISTHENKKETLRCSLYSCERALQFLKKCLHQYDWCFECQSMPIPRVILTTGCELWNKLFVVSFVDTTKLSTNSYENRGSRKNTLKSVCYYSASLLTSHLKALQCFPLYGTIMFSLKGYRRSSAASVICFLWTIWAYYTQECAASCHVSICLPYAFWPLFLSKKSY